MTYVFNSSGHCTSAINAPPDFSLSYSHHEAKSRPTHHRYSICSRLKNCTQTEFINCCWYRYFNLESEFQPALFCSLLLLKAYSIMFFSNLRPDNRAQTIGLIVQHAYLDNRSSLLKTFGTSRPMRN